MDFSFLLEPPDFSEKKLLIIEPLTPLSMVAGLPGKYYRSQSEPTNIMLWGMLENALGWHIDYRERNELLKKIKKKLNVEPMSSGLGYTSILQHHVKISKEEIPSIRSESFHYDDLWSQHLKGASFVGGSRNYSKEAIPLMNALGMYKDSDKITIGDTGKADKNPTKLSQFEKGDTIHMNVLRPYFPQYYVSPTPREYVVPNRLFAYSVQSSSFLLDMIHAAIQDPSAPLYLGSNDGWVEVRMEEFV